MSQLREEELISSLQKVSLQRLRSLKMDLDKLARDSRIQSENSFWSLLELHEIRLDDRTRREFSQLVVDNRGVNTEKAIRHLRNAHRQTGRDSVEVLPKETRQPEAAPKRLTPEATPTFKFTAPSSRQGTRNYKLDKLRSKVIGIGKLASALKQSGSPFKLPTENSNEKPGLAGDKTKMPVTAVQGILSKQTGASDPSPAKDPAEVQKLAKVSSTGGKRITVQEKSQSRNESLQHSAQSSAEEPAPSTVQKPLLRILLEPDSADEANSRENAFSGNRLALPAAQSLGKAATASAGMRKGDTFSEKEKGNEVNSTGRDSKENEAGEEKQKEIKSEQPNLDGNRAEDKKSTGEEVKVQDSNTSKIKSVDDEGEDNQATEASNEKDPGAIAASEAQTLSSEAGEEASDSGKLSSQVTVSSEGATQVQSKTPALDRVETNAERAQEEPTSGELTNGAADLDDEDKKKIEKHEAGDKSFHDKKRDRDAVKTPDASKHPDGEIVADGMVVDRNEVEDSSSVCSEVGSGNAERQDTDHSVDGEKVVAGNRPSSPTLASTRDAAEAEAVDQDSVLDQVDFVASERSKANPEREAHSGEESRTSAVQKSSLGDHEDDASQRKLVSHKQEDSNEETMSPETIAQQDTGDKGDEMLGRDFDKTDREDGEVSRQSDPEDNAEVRSSSTLSSEEEETLSFNQILRNASSSSCSTEKVVIGESEIELAIPSWLEGNTYDPKYAESVHSDLSIDWVYGCTTNHAQSMAVLDTGELVYYVGCVVIIYNHTRKTQRHYLEHTANVTCVAVHPSEPRGASAQSARSRDVLDIHEMAASSPSFGQIHIRVWNSDTLDTLTVIGIGILRSLVLRMQFVDYQGYFVSLENDIHCTLTLWKGGCRVTSINTAVEEPQTRPAFRSKHATSSSTTNSARSHKQRSVLPKPSRSDPSFSNAAKVEAKNIPAKPNHSINPLGPRCIASGSAEDRLFATGGKRYLSFMKIVDELDGDYDHDENPGVKMSQPIIGDFGKNFFKAEYISCCCTSNKFADATILTGDSNGTLLMWSEAEKTPTCGFAHAHECHLSAICVNSEGIIFTSGARDKLVKAFSSKRAKVECCGRIKVPSELGSATCLVASKKTLFVATERNAILAVATDNLHNSVPLHQGGSPQLPKAESLKMLGRRSQSSHGLGLSKTKVQANGSGDDNSKENKSVFSTWEPIEVARGFGGGGVCVCPIAPMKYKPRKRKMNVSNAEEHFDTVSSSLPHFQTPSSTPKGQISKSSGFSKAPYEFGAKRFPTQAWKSRNDSSGGSNQLKLPATSYPRLHAHERILSREKAKSDDTNKTNPICALTDHVQGQNVFCTDESQKAALGDFFVAAARDGWLFLCSSGERTIMARCKIPEVRIITSIDACARRHLVAVGTQTGKVVLLRIDKSSFEILPALQCRCSGGGKSTINRLRFSPSGRRLAISVGYDIVVCVIRRLALIESGRCIGHHSSFIFGLDWSARKYSGSYFLRSCATKPLLEIKTWHSDTLLEINIHPRIRWSTQSCLMDYAIKGLWQTFCKATDVTCHGVRARFHSNDMKREASDEDSPRSSGEDSSVLCAGDSDGFLSLLTYPCLEMSEMRSFRAHYSSIANVEFLSEQRHVMSTANDDSALVQWKLS